MQHIRNSVGTGRFKTIQQYPLRVKFSNPIGKSIKVVEVFMTHILIEAETSINPPTNLDPLLPMAINIFNARRLCKPEDSIPKAKIKPPINK